MKIDRLKTSFGDTANMAASYLDKLIPAPRVSDMQPSPVFIIGPPRSGTTLTYQILIHTLKLNYFNHMMDILYGAPFMTARLSGLCPRKEYLTYKSHYGHIPGLCSPSESPSFWYYHGVLPRFTNHRNTASLPADVNMLRLHELISRLSCQQGGDYVFKCVYLALNIQLLSRVFKHAKFIITKRDPISTCKSLYRAKLAKANRINWWSVKPPDFDEYRNKPLHVQAAFQVAATEAWIEHDLLDLEHNRYRKINYEDLCRNPRPVIEDVADWLTATQVPRQSFHNLPESFNISWGPSLSKTEEESLANAYIDQKSIYEEI